MSHYGIGWEWLIKMKLIPILLSVMLISYLALDFVESSGLSQQNQANNKLIEFVQPQRVTKELLLVEKKWQDLKTQRATSSEPTEDVQTKPNNQQMLTLGEHNYVLYGIFNDPESPFILLKDESENMIKLAKGGKLTESATLVTLQSNMIAFDKNNQIIEFKLFERKNNAPN